MQLKIKRDQADVKGLLGGHKGVKFSLTARADVTPEEKALIDKYKVGEYILGEWTFKDLTGHVTVTSLLSGFSHTTDNIGTLIKLEDTLKDNCRTMKNLLAIMRTFGGEEVHEI